MYTIENEKLNFNIVLLFPTPDARSSRPINRRELIADFVGTRRENVGILMSAVAEVPPETLVSEVVPFWVRPEPIRVGLLHDVLAREYEDSTRDGILLRFPRKSRVVAY